MPIAYKVFNVINGELTPLTDIGLCLVPKFEVGKDVTAPIGGFFMHSSLLEAMRYANDAKQFAQIRPTIRKVRYARPLTASMSFWPSAFYSCYPGNYNKDVLKDAWRRKRGVLAWWVTEAKGTIVARTIHIYPEEIPCP